MKLLPPRLTPVRFADRRFAPPRWAPLRFALARSAPLRLASFRLAPTRSAPLRLAPTRWAPRRFTRRRSAPSRFAPARSHATHARVISSFSSFATTSAKEPFPIGVSNSANRKNNCSFLISTLLYPRDTVLHTHFESDYPCDTRDAKIGHSCPSGNNILCPERRLRLCRLELGGSGRLADQDRGVRRT